MNQNKTLVLLFAIFFPWILPIGGADAKSAPYYSVHGASYQSLEPLEQHIKALQDKGYEAFYERVDIPRQGKWYRMYIGRYDSKDLAQQAADKLKTGKVIPGFHIRRVMLPLETAVMPVKKTKKLEGRHFDLFYPVIAPPQGQKTRARLGNNEPQSDGRQDVATQREGKIMASPGQQPGSPAPVPAAPTTVQKKTAPVGQEDRSPLDGAKNEFKAQRYDRALTMLQSILSQPSQPEALRSAALRLAADCYYFLGLKGNAKLLLTAADQYKIILTRYPDPAAGNDLAYYHLAQSNENLSFFYESAGALERLIAAYPDSTFLAEAMFKLGSLLKQTGKYSQAIERLIAYVKKYPAGEYAKTASFMIGDCYYLLHKQEFASLWYNEACKKWPDFHDIPLNTIMNMGNSYFATGAFNSSLQVFSLYHNLFPTDELGKTSLYMMARNAEAMGETAMALRLYSLLINQYPKTSEAETCLLAMAALGVAKAGTNFPSHVLGIDAYRSPLNVFDSQLAQSPDGEKEAALLLLKGDALVQLNRSQEALTAYLTLISRFPQGKSTNEGRKRLKLQIKSLVNENYEKGDYLAVADIYFQSYGKDLTPWEDFATAARMGNSLLTTGLYNEAEDVYGTLKKIYRERERENILTLALAKIDLAKNREQAAEEKLLDLLTASGSKNPALRNDIKVTLADLYYKKKLTAKAIPLYADVLLTGAEGQGGAYRNYGRALQEAKLSDKAIVNYLKALQDHERHPNSYQTDLLVEIYDGLGEAYYDLKRYPEGIAAYRQALSHAGKENIEVGKWLAYMIGKGSTHLKDFTAAEKSFAQVKVNAVGEFWPKVTDYALDRGRP